MKEIKTLETVVKQNVKSPGEFGINATLFRAYRASKETGNEFIDFNEVIWDCDIVEIAQALRANGITGFTISSTSSSLLKTLIAFEKQGISTAGLTIVKTRYTDWKTGEHALTPAIQMAAKEA